MESKYTKKERHRLYKKALKLLKECDYSPGLCSKITEAGCVMNMGISYYGVMHELCLKNVEQTKFPELVKQRPVSSCICIIDGMVFPQVDFWYLTDEDGKKARIFILENAIKETE